MWQKCHTDIRGIENPKPHFSQNGPAKSPMISTTFTRAKTLFYHQKNYAKSTS
jgi:hypothetical protein